MAHVATCKAEPLVHWQEDVQCHVPLNGCKASALFPVPLQLLSFHCSPELDLPEQPPFATAANM